VAFLRRKNVRGYTYYQLVRNYREEGKHRQEVLEHLGRHDSLEGAILAEERKVTRILKSYQTTIAYWQNKAEIARQNAKRYYYLHGQGVEVLDASDAYARRRELNEQYEAVRRSSGLEEAWDRVYKPREAELTLIQSSIAYHDSKDNAAYYEEKAEECRARLDRLLELMDKYPQPIRSSETVDILDRWKAKKT
jgi:phage shock protein A